jgi:transmembrane sensor
MTRLRLHNLLKHYLEKSGSDLEQKEFQKYLNDPIYTEEIKKLIGDEFDQQVDYVELLQNEQHEILKRIYAEERNQSGKLRKLWLRMAIAGAVTISVIGAGLFYYQQTVKQAESTLSTYKSDIAPGKFAGTLTLSDGRKISLSEAGNGKLASETGVLISKSANGKLIYEAKDAERNTNQMNTLSTAKGETYQVRLPDGSLVWLNAASSLTYPASLTLTGKRKVKLDGEAYFEVAKDKEHPFIVESKGQQVEVLGTHFNVNTYTDELVTVTTLFEGAVRVTTGRDHKNIIPGEQATNAGTQIKVSPANLENVMDWKNGDFSLNHVNFKQAMRKIARWYNVEIIYDTSISDDMEAGGWVSRDKPLSSVLKAIEYSGLVKFRIEGRKIYVIR